jgi:hypothetical protein
MSHWGLNSRKKPIWCCLAAHTRASPGAKRNIKNISVQDNFPKVKKEEARNLVQQGIKLLKKSKIAAYRVISRGPECTPVLETKLFDDKGRPGGWGAYSRRI